MVRHSLSLCLFSFHGSTLHPPPPLTPHPSPSIFNSLYICLLLQHCSFALEATNEHIASNASVSGRYSPETSKVELETFLYRFRFLFCIVFCGFLKLYVQHIFYGK